MDREKIIHQLFIGKIADVLGFEKTTELLEEAKEALDDRMDDTSDVSKCDHPKEDRHGSGYLEAQYCMKCGKVL